MDLRQKSNNLAVWSLFSRISRIFRYKGNQFPLLEKIVAASHGDLKSHAAADKYSIKYSDEYTSQAGIVEDTETYVCALFPREQRPLFEARALCRPKQRFYMALGVGFHYFFSRVSFFFFIFGT